MQVAALPGGNDPNYQHFTDHIAFAISFLLGVKHPLAELRCSIGTKPSVGLPQWYDVVDADSRFNPSRSIWLRHARSRHRGWGVRCSPVN